MPYLFPEWTENHLSLFELLSHQNKCVHFWEVAMSLFSPLSCACPWVGIEQTLLHAFRLQNVMSDRIVRTIYARPTAHTRYGTYVMGDSIDILWN